MVVFLFLLIAVNLCHAGHFENESAWLLNEQDLKQGWTARYGRGGGRKVLGSKSPLSRKTKPMDVFNPEARQLPDYTILPTQNNLSNQCDFQEYQEIPLSPQEDRAVPSSERATPLSHLESPLLMLARPQSSEKLAWYKGLFSCLKRPRTAD